MFKSLNKEREKQRTKNGNVELGRQQERTRRKKTEVRGKGP